MMALAAWLLAGCESVPAPLPLAGAASVAMLYQRPAEHALFEGMHQYQDGAFERSESSLRHALSLGLADPHDSATAFKLLAFIACAFDRPRECEQDFASALRADPDFSLTPSEIGHPVWGPVYRKVAAAFGHTGSD